MKNIADKFTPSRSYEPSVVAEWDDEGFKQIVEFEQENTASADLNSWRMTTRDGLEMLVTYWTSHEAYTVDIRNH